MVSPQAQRAAVTVPMTGCDFVATRARGIVRVPRSLHRYRSRRPDSAPLRARIEDVAAGSRQDG